MKDLIDKMKMKGIKFKRGLSQKEIEKAELNFDVKFPSEIKAFLSCGVPIGSGFYNWRDFSKENTDKIKNFQNTIEESFLFDFEENHLSDMFKDKFPDAKDETELRKLILDFLHSSTKLVPFYRHRCFFSGMDNMPIISFEQPTDTIIYGANFENYLATEFFERTLNFTKQDISKDFQQTGIWKDLIE